MAKLCPLCRTDMVVFHVDTLVLDHCESCDGVWYDAQELGDYGKKMGLGKISRRRTRFSGDPIDGFSCPRCVTVPLASTQQDQLTMYGCSNCHGWFVGGPEMSTLRRRYTEKLLAKGHRPATTSDEEASGKHGLLAGIRGFFFR